MSYYSYFKEKRDPEKEHVFPDYTVVWPKSPSRGLIQNHLPSLYASPPIPTPNQLLSQALPVTLEPKSLCEEVMWEIGVSS